MEDAAFEKPVRSFNNNIRLWWSAVCILTTLAASFGQDSSAVEDLRSEIDKLIRFETTIDYNDVPGFTIGLVDGDNTVILAFGTTAPGDTHKLSATDRFEVGSVTKPYTAALVAEMADAGLIGLNDRVSEYLRSGQVSEAVANIRVVDLLTHTSGLPRLPTMFGDTQQDPNNPYAGYTTTDFDEYLASAEIDTSNLPLYSHVAFALLERVIEIASGMPFNQAFDKYLGSPIGFSCTSFSEGDSLIRGFDLARRPAEPWEFPTFKASEGMRTCIDDGIKAIQYFLRSYPGMIYNKSEDKFNKTLGISPGWFVITDRRAPDVFAHTGRTSRHSAYLAVVPSTKTGVVILANSASGTQDLGLQILRMMNNNWKRKN